MPRDPVLQVRLEPRRPRHGRRIGLTALTDLVFILLIFFILETNFVEFNQLDFSQPKAAVERQEGQGDDAPPEAAETGALTIQLFASGRLWIDGETLSLNALGAYLAERSFGPETIILVETESAAPVQLLVTALDQLHAARLARVSVRDLERAHD